MHYVLLNMNSVCMGNVFGSCVTSSKFHNNTKAITFCALSTGILSGITLKVNLTNHNQTILGNLDS